MFYDIYLSTGCSKPSVNLPPELGKISADLAQRLRERHHGFLGLDLPRDTARTYLHALKTAGARGGIVPTAYRTPHLTVEAAQVIAEQALAQLQLRYPGLQFDPVGWVPAMGNPRWWTFGSVVPAWLAQGYVPGMLMVSVDKLDGHLWTDEELDDLAASQ